MHSFIHLRLPKIDPAQRSLAANTAFFELASNIVSANIFAKRSLDQHSRAGGKLETGRVLDYGGKHNRKMCSLFLSMMDKCGAHLNEFGDSTERLTEV